MTTTQQPVRLVFVDIETTSLDPDSGEIWEVGFVVRDGIEGDWEHVALLDVTLQRADPISLSIGRFHERHHQGNRGHKPDPETVYSPADFARVFSDISHGAHLVGNVVSFDEERLRRLLRRHGIVPSWNYHLVDVEAMIAGKLGIEPPWKSTRLAEALGVPVLGPDKAHMALEDARWSRDLYDAVLAS